MKYIEKYIARLEEENSSLRLENNALRESLRETRNLLSIAIEK